MLGLPGRGERRQVSGLAWVGAMVLGSVAGLGNAQSAPPAGDPLADPASISLIGKPEGETPARKAREDRPSVPGEARRYALLLRLVTPPAEEATRRSFGPPPAGLPPLRSDLIELLAELDDSSLDVREEASRTLADELRVDELELVSMTWAAQTPEQAGRLLREHRRRFDAEPHAAIGVNFGAEDPRDTAQQTTRISNFVEGFPAGKSGLLRVGDVIVAVGGIGMFDPITGEAQNARARSAVVSYPAHSFAEMIVRRRYAGGHYAGFVGRQCGIFHLDQSVRVEVPLGAWSRLGVGRPTPPLGAAELEQAWRYRAARVGMPFGSPTVYREQGDRLPDQVRARLSTRGRTADDFLPQSVFRDEHVAGLNLRSLQRKQIAQQQQLNERVMGQALPNARNAVGGGAMRAPALGGAERWVGRGRDADGEVATSITIVERRGGIERFLGQGKGDPLALARRIAQARADASAFREQAQAAPTPEARAKASERAVWFDERADDWARQLAVQDHDGPEKADAGEGAQQR